MITWNEIERRAVEFQQRWKNCVGDERQEAQTFEKDFMEVFGVNWHEGLHEYQLILNDGSIGYVDYFLPGKILIEMKSKGKSLAKAYSQAMGYVHALKPDEVPRLVMVSDFHKIEVYNLKKDHPYKPFKVTQLKQHVRIFGLIAGYDTKVEEKTEIEVNTDASYKMANIHDALKENGYEGHNLEVFLVRLLFCLFADDAGIFEKGAFQKYIEEAKDDGSDLSMRLMMLFSILNTPPEKRMKTLSCEMSRFRYINGTIFQDSLPPASFNENMRKELFDCCKDFDWTQISPSIFGAMFQGVMDQNERRSLGAHYTSEENILKLIRPLFLDDLYDEFEQSKSTTAELKSFHNKLASLKFLDPACGSGNFLIVTYKKLRELEFEVLKLLYDNQQLTMVDSLIKVKPEQFYGIECEDFPCQIATLSMVLMKHLMDQEVSNYFGFNLIDFPIRDNANIIHCNALRIDWDDVCPSRELSYIIGNPPFIGYPYQTAEQKADIRTIFLDNEGRALKTAGKVDYVACWFYKAAQYMQFSNIQAAFVSTNSICQGEQVADVWEPIVNQFRVHINFAYRTFVWHNEAKGKAAVHCIIVGLSHTPFKGTKRIYESDGTVQEVEHINAYLVDAPDIFICSRTSPLCNVSIVRKGSQPTDGGLFFFSEEEKKNLMKNYPEAKALIRPFLGAKEYIQGLTRYCLWLKDISPEAYAKIPPIMERISGVRQYRLSSPKAKTIQDADSPSLFQK